MIMIFEITPLDPLFFRDGRPFTMGDESAAGSFFPPMPSTVYGALRSAYIAHNGGLGRFESGEMRETVGTKESGGSFSLKGVFLRWGDEIFLPAPLDLGKNKDQRNGTGVDELLRLSPVPRKHLPCVLSPKIKAECLLLPEGGDLVEDPTAHLISVATFREYQTDGASSFFGRTLGSMVMPEPKMGIKRNADTHAAEDGFLYRVGMLRLASRNPDGSVVKAGLIAVSSDVEGFPDEFMLKLGGEGRPCRARKASSYESQLGFEELSSEVKEKIVNNGRFRLYLATPAIFDKGWLPVMASIDGKEVFFQDGELRLRLLYVVLGRPQHVGGWDIQEKKPKAMRRAVPAGSVYCLEILEGDPAMVMERFHMANISDHLAEQGFGLTLVGACR